MIVAYLAERAGGTEDIRDMGGIAFRAPVLAALFLIVALANLAMPGSSNFVGEFLILLGVFHSKLVIASIAFTGVGMARGVLAAALHPTMHNRVGADVDVARHQLPRGPRARAARRGDPRSSPSVPQLALKKGEPAITEPCRPRADLGLRPPQPQQASATAQPTP